MHISITWYSYCIEWCSEFSVQFISPYWFFWCVLPSKTPEDKRTMGDYSVPIIMLNAAGNDNNVSVDVLSTQSLELAAVQTRAKRAEILAKHQALLISVLAELLSSHSLERALDALAGALKKRFSCERVAIALDENGDLKLAAVSQQGVLETTSSEACLLVDAMREACENESSVCWPPASDDLGILAAHRSLAGRRVSTSLCSVPLYDKQKLVGALLLERRDKREFPVLTLERLSVCLAPLLVLHRQADRSWWSLLKQSLSSKLEYHLGRDRPGMRLLFAVSAVIFVFSLSMKTHWQIVAPAELLSHERRVITTPQAGFIVDLHVVAGDRVEQGQLLARLDSREIELDATSKKSEVTMAEAEFRVAMASYDHQTAGIARARLAQARARLAGVEQRLSRMNLLSPIDGVIISSDATRASGTPVSRGENLFEIATGTNFDVHVLIDEEDVYDVYKGQTGLLSLRAMPGEHIPIIVESVYPVAEARDGQNRFRVRAALIDPEARLRPGQSGVVRLQGGRASFLSVLTRQLNRRLAELWWRWVG